MDGINKVILIGTTGKDPEVRVIPNSQKRVANFSLVTNKKYRDSSGNQKEDAQWHNIECWDFNADLAANYIKKGTNIYIEGEIKYESWEDPIGSGNKKYRTKIVADYIRLLPGGTRNENQSNGTQQQYPQNPPAQQQYPQNPPMQQQYPQNPPAQQQYPQNPPMQQQYPQNPPMQQQYPQNPPAQQNYPQNPPAQQNYPQNTAPQNNVSPAVQNAQENVNQYMTGNQFRQNLATGTDDLPF